MNTTSPHGYNVRNPRFSVTHIYSKSFSDRLVPLSDGTVGLRGTINVEITDPGEDMSLQSARTRVPDLSSTTAETSCNPCLDFVSSDETIDRYGEVIHASGWKLSGYHRNPVFQNAHQYGDIIFTLGKALITEVRTRPPSTINSQPSSYLFQRIQFATDVNPIAKIAYGLYRGKFLNAVSVGFLPLEWEDGNAKADYSRKYLEQELLEVSAVAIPANPHALALAFNSGAVERADLSDLADLIHETLDTSRSAPVQSPIAARHARLISLARQLHALLRHS
jgi:hypothetical protein